MFGKGGTKFLNWVKDYKNNREKKAIAHLKLLCKDPKLTAEHAYKIKKSKCWKNYFWELTYSIRDKVDNLSSDHLDYLSDVKRAKDMATDAKYEIRANKYEEVKEQKWFPYVAYTITFALLGVFIYAIGYMGYAGAKMVDWYGLGKWTLYLIGGAVGYCSVFDCIV